MAHSLEKKEKEIEQSYQKLVKSIDNNDNDNGNDIHDEELEYRPYKYKSTAVTRPNLKSCSNGNGILYTQYDEDHEYNYFRYWFGRYKIFRNLSKQLMDDLKSVIIRDEYDFENVREDMIITDQEYQQQNENENDESMILNEDEFEKYHWKIKERNTFRLICCEVIDILPFYKEWINELKSYQSINDLIPKIDSECPSLPCPSINRLLILCKFYKRWIEQNFDENLKPKKKGFHFSVHDFMDCLEHYNSVEFQNDYQHLQHCHIEPINAMTKMKNDNNNNNNNDNDGDSTDNDDDEDDDDDDDNSSDDTDDDEKDNIKINNTKKKKKIYNVVLDSENRNIYEYFEDNLGERDPEKCAIFERTYRSRYDSNFENKTEEYYILNKKEKQDWLQRVSEIQYQRIFDGIYTILFHSSARFDCMGLGNSEEHRKFVILSTQKRKAIKKENNNSNNK